MSIFSTVFIEKGVSMVSKKCFNLSFRLWIKSPHLYDSRENKYRTPQYHTIYIMQNKEFFYLLKIKNSQEHSCKHKLIQIFTMWFENNKIISIQIFSRRAKVLFTLHFNQMVIGVFHFHLFVLRRNSFLGDNFFVRLKFPSGEVVKTFD